MRLKKNSLLRCIVTASAFANISCLAEVDNCDLAFVYAGDGEFDSAISGATAGEESTRDYTHVGIIETSKDGDYVLEAEPIMGVTRTPIEDFIKNNKNIDIYHVSGSFDKDFVIQKAKSFLGQKYDYTFLPDNNLLYCSELVYECFLDRSGNHIFEANPMNFISKDGSLADFWKNLFDDLGMEVPQGVPGTNPNDMAKSARLRLVKTITYIEDL